MASKPSESTGSKLPTDDNQCDLTPTLIDSEMRVVDDQDEPSIELPENVDVPENSANDSPKGLINEYHSAVNYISNLIDQLSDKPGVPKTVESFAKNLAESNLGSCVTQVVPHEATDDDLSTVQLEGSDLLEDSDGSDSQSSITMQLAGANAGRVRAEPKDTERAGNSGNTQTQVYPTAEEADSHSNSMLHNLRKAAHIATSASLELNDCATSASRAYSCVILGCASSLFSIVLASMSPHATTLGFGVSMATFALALGLGLKYLISFRFFVNRSAQALKSRAKAVDSKMPFK